MSTGSEKKALFRNNTRKSNMRTSFRISTAVRTKVHLSIAKVKNAVKDT